ncbi:MAG: hypothetical protein ACJAXX_001462, partial [Roseivirga sp.]
MKIYNSVFFFCFFMSVSANLSAQSVGIGKIDFEPDSAAILELKSDNQGLLIPRLTLLQKESIQNPPLGLLVFQTDVPIGFHFYSQSSWTYLIDFNQIGDLNFQNLAFDVTSGILSLENGGSVDLSIYLKGKTVLNGEVDPNDTTGVDGDFYVNTNTLQIFGPKAAGTWGAGTAIIGTDGINGIDGTNGIDGADGINGSNGVDGINGIDGVDGTNGADGIDGADGPNGQHGKTVLNGEVDPNDTTGVDGDFYINTSSLQIFGPKAAGTWGAGTAIIGTDGINGIDGTNGIDGADGINGSNGVDGINGIDGVDGTNGADGIDGVDGATGQDGKTVLNGEVDPNDTTG